MTRSLLIVTLALLLAAVFAHAVVVDEENVLSLSLQAPEELEAQPVGDAIQQAIEFEREAFQKSAAPYAGRCLGFVKDAYASAGVHRDYLDQGSAKEGAAVAKQKAGWTHYSGTDVPAGAVLFWSGCSSNGHAALSIGGSNASSNGDGVHWNGKFGIAVEWLNEHWCGSAPDGYIIP
eukprot:EC792271.1.p1 GENE.EC792271.1~~EC792271.1.p1  ORF type:complete len:177 (+),score=53.73 EC792271.1:36-566(+)